jgi:hypothetical protein
MGQLLDDLMFEFRRHKAMAERAMAELGDGAFFERPGPVVNPVALIVKHLGGNLASRWSEFLGTDGEKPTRDRDGEFLLKESDTRARLMDEWERGWNILFATLQGLDDADLQRVVRIRGEELLARQALLRGLTHASYHVGQILYLARLLAPGRPWLTIPPGGSSRHPGNYRTAN